MSALRLLRVLRTRWWLVVLIALLGAGVALGAAEYRNRGLVPIYEAKAPISVIRLANENDEAFSRRLNTVAAQARSALTNELPDGAGVEADAGTGRVLFVAMASDAIEAEEAAEALRAEYLAFRPADTPEDQLAPVLEALAEDITLLAEQLAGLQGSNVDPIVEAERTAIRAQIDAAAVELVSINVQLLDPNLPEAERIDLETQLVDTEAVIASLGARLEQLPSVSGSISETQRRLDASVVEQQLRTLESQYIATALRRSDDTNEGLVGDTNTTDESEERTSITMAALVGLIAGGLIGTLGILATEKLRQPVRAPDDVPGLTMIKVSHRPRRQAGTPLWYQSAVGEGRRTEIQALRARLEQSTERGSVVLVGAVSDSQVEAQDLAIDLASAIAVTGRAVLFVEILTGDGPRRPLWPQAGPTLGEMLQARHGHLPDRAAIKRLMWDRSEVAPNLIVVPAGTIDQDPVDALAGTAFAIVIEEAQELVDVVILSTGRISNPDSEAVLGRANVAVLVAHRERTRVNELVAAMKSVERTGTRLGPVALLPGGHRRGSKRGPQDGSTAPRRGKQAWGTRHRRQK